MADVSRYYEARLAEHGETGWDSEMIAYPFVFDHKGNRYMLYNGNSYGKRVEGFRG